MGPGHSVFTVWPTQSYKAQQNKKQPRCPREDKLSLGSAWCMVPTCVGKSDLRVGRDFTLGPSAGKSEHTMWLSYRAPAAFSQSGEGYIDSAHPSSKSASVTPLWHKCAPVTVRVHTA